MEYKQLSFFDLEGIKPEPEVLLNVSQHIYKVIRGDVDELIYTGETWLCDEGKERGYRLKQLKGCYDCTWNREIGSIVFYNREDACTVAKKYQQSHDVILASDICPVKTIAYQCGCLTAFYSELPDGSIYMKEFRTFAHLVLPKNVKKFVKFFMNQPEITNHEAVLIPNYIPKFKNMYKIRQDYDWDYSEAHHSYAVG